MSSSEMAGVQSTSSLSTTCNALLELKLASQRTAPDADTKKYYLGNPLLLTDIQWQEANPHNILISKEDAQNFLKDPSAELQEVPLVVIGQIAAEGFDFRPTGQYIPGTKDYSELENHKAVCIIRRPDIGLSTLYGLDNDWETIERNVNVIQKISYSGDRDRQHFWVSKGGQEGIRISHKLFESLAEVDEDEPKDDPDADDGWNINNWPVKTDCARAALERISETHRLKVPRIFTAEGQLMNPLDYPSQLRNAIVQCYFEVAHWNIGYNRSVFTPRLIQMRVLRPPVNVSPKKRARKSKDVGPEYDGSPSKRPRS